jgi:hypothetical protein
VAVGEVQRRRLHVRPRGRAHHASIYYAGRFSVSVGITWLDLTSFE